MLAQMGAANLVVLHTVDEARNWSMRMAVDGIVLVLHGAGRGMPDLKDLFQYEMVPAAACRVLDGASA